MFWVLVAWSAVHHIDLDIPRITLLLGWGKYDDEDDDYCVLTKYDAICPENY